MINCRMCGTETKRLPDGGLLCRSCWNERARAMIQAKQRFVDRVRSLHPCQVCGEDDPDVLEFHHVIKEGMYKRQVTRSGVYRGSGVVSAVWDNLSVKRIVEEMNRCAMLCANCHRKAEVGKITTLTPLNIPLPPKGNRYNWESLREWMESYRP